MNGYLLDTNVLSEYSKPKANPKVHAWLLTVPSEVLFVSVLTFGEIQRGISKLPTSTRKNHLQSWLDSDLKAKFAGRVLSVGAELAELWGDIMGNSDASGRPLPVVDSLLAATAIHHDLTFATRDTGELAITGVHLFNPWEDRY